MPFASAFARATVFFAIAIAPPASAVTPRDFDHAWGIVTSAPNTTYRVELPEQAILSTRHHWADSVVLDAGDHPMPFSVSDTNGIAASTQQPRRLKCSPQAAAGSTNLVYRCVAAQAIDNVYGVRIKGRRLPNPHTPLKVDVRDQDGAILAKFDGEAGLMMGFTISGTPIAFGGTHRIEALEFEIFTPGQEVAEVEIAAAPISQPAQWRPLELIQSAPDHKGFVYTVNFAIPVTVVRLDLDTPLPATTGLTISGCPKPDCISADLENTGEADALALGPGHPSFPVHLRNYGTEQPFVQIRSSIALSKAPGLEMAWNNPTLVFTASGAAPYTFAVGQTTIPANARYNFSPQRNVPTNRMPVATLAPYSALDRFGSNLLNLAGVGILLLALTLAAAWIYWRRRRATAPD